MAYGQIIYTGFYDIAGDLWQLEIEQMDYTGASNHVAKMGGTPLSFEYGKSTRLPHEKPVFDTRLSFSLESLALLQFDYLFSPSLKKNKAIVKYKGNIIFVGFLVGDTYAEPYKPPPFFVSFNAMDGLLLLKNRDWDIEERLPQLEIITKCLLETGLALNFTTSISTVLIEPSVSANPLENVYENGEAYINGNSTYFDILEDILKKYGATIKQVAGAWEIAQINDQALTLPVTRTYDSTGTLIGTGTAPAILSPAGTGINNGLVIKNSSVIRINPAFKEFVIKQELGVRDNILRNGDFSKTYLPDPTSVLPVLKNWESNGSLFALSISDNNLAVLYESTTANPIDEVYMQITDPNLKYIKQYVGQIYDETDSRVNRDMVYLTFEIKFGLIGVETNPVLMNGDVYVKIKIGGSSVAITTTDNVTRATWWAGDHVFKIGTATAKDQERIEFKTFKVDFAPKLIQSGDIEVYLYQAINCDTYSGQTVLATVFESVTLKVTTAARTKPDNNKEIVSEINANSNYVPKDFKIIAGDLPIGAFSRFSYDNYLSIADGSPTTTWRYITPGGLTVEDELLIILAAQIEQLFQQPRLLLQTNIISDIVRFNSRISDPARMPGKIFAITRATFDPKKLAWKNVEMLEMNGEVLPDFDNSDFDNSDFDT